MKFVAYNIETGKALRVKGNGVGVWKDAHYSTKGAATRAANKANKEAGKTVAASASWEEFTNGISPIHENGKVKMVPVKNIMTGETVMEAADTPYYLSVASESYWSA